MMLYCLQWVIHGEFPFIYCHVIPPQSTLFSNATHMIKVNMNSVLRDARGHASKLALASTIG